MKDFSLTRLFDRYGPLLTEKQQSAFSLYYNEDFSLSEIAEHTGTSRQAVRSLIQKTEEELRRFERVLHLVEKEHRISRLVSRSAEEDAADLRETLGAILALVKE